MIVSALLNKLDYLDVKVTLKELAKTAGIDTSTLCKFIKREIAELDFYPLVLIHYHIIHDMDDMKDWCMILEKPKNIKSAMEFLAVNNYLTELEEVISRELKSANKSNTEWANVYSLLLAFRKKTMPYSELLAKVHRYQAKCDELVVFLKILEANIYFQMLDSKSMYRASQEAELLVADLKHSFIKDMYTARVRDLLMKSFLYFKTDLPKAREYAQKNISYKLSPFLQANGYYSMSVSYWFEDYDISHEYTVKAIEAYEFAKDPGIAKWIKTNTLPFIGAVWGKELTYNEDTDISEVAHYNAKWGDKQKALEILDTLDETAFTICYKGVASQNPMLLIDSLSKFLSDGETFYAQLPYKELKGRHPYNEIADVMLRNHKH